MNSMGVSASQTGLASPEGPEPASRLRPTGGIPDANEPDWFLFGKAFLRAVLFQRATRGNHVVGRDGRAKMGFSDLLGCEAVDDIAREFCQHTGIPFEDIEGPTEHEAMYMGLAGLRWVDWLENASKIRADARGTGHPSKVNMSALAQAIEARRARPADDPGEPSAAQPGIRDSGGA